MHNKAVPFNDLPYLPPKKDIETKKILKQLIKSSQLLAELKGFSEIIPNKSMLVNAIVLHEAKDSSEIENIITTQDTLYQAVSSSLKITDAAVKEVLNYRSALWKGYELIKTKGILSTNIIIEIQKELLKTDTGIRKIPGTALKNDKTGEIIYTPPQGEYVIRDFLKNFEEFANNVQYLHPLIKMAVLHYQFEAIHPFYDGNGRTGRILNVLFLTLTRLLDLPILYLSQYIIHNKAKYYHLLSNVTHNNDWENWILFLLKAVAHTSSHTLNLCKNIILKLEQAQNKVKTKKPKIYSKELIEIIFQNIYTKINHLVENKIASRNIASKYLKELVNLNVLEQKKVGKEVLFINKELYNLFKNR